MLKESHIMLYINHIPLPKNYTIPEHTRAYHTRAYQSIPEYTRVK